MIGKLATDQSLAAWDIQPLVKCYEFRLYGGSLAGLLVTVNVPRTLVSFRSPELTYDDWDAGY